jgi:hypothetical protein
MYMPDPYASLSERTDTYTFTGTREKSPATKRTLFQRLKRWMARRKIQQGVAVLRNVDKVLRDAGYIRQERRKMWREIVSSSGVREHLLDALEKEGKDRG